MIFLLYIFHIIKRNILIVGITISLFFLTFIGSFFNEKNNDKFQITKRIIQNIPQKETIKENIIKFIAIIIFLIVIIIFYLLFYRNRKVKKNLDKKNEIDNIFLLENENKNENKENEKLTIYSKPYKLESREKHTTHTCKSSEDSESTTITFHKQQNKKTPMHRSSEHKTNIVTPKRRVETPKSKKKLNLKELDLNIISEKGSKIQDESLETIKNIEEKISEEESSIIGEKSIFYEYSKLLNSNKKIKISEEIFQFLIKKLVEDFLKSRKEVYCEGKFKTLVSEKDKNNNIIFKSGVSSITYSPGFFEEEDVFFIVREGLINEFFFESIESINDNNEKFIKMIENKEFSKISEEEKEVIKKNVNELNNYFEKINQKIKKNNFNVNEIKKKQNTKEIFFKKIKDISEKGIAYDYIFEELSSYIEEFEKDFGDDYFLVTYKKGSKFFGKKLLNKYEVKFIGDEPQKEFNTFKTIFEITKNYKKSKSPLIKNFFGYLLYIISKNIFIVGN